MKLRTSVTMASALVNLAIFQIGCDSGKVQQLQSQVEYLQAELAAAQERLDNVKNQLENVQSEFETLKSQIDEAVDATDGFYYYDWRSVVSNVRSALEDAQSYAINVESAIEDAINEIE